MPQGGYGWRIGFLILLLSLVPLFDLVRHGSSSTKWREYSFLLLAGMLGALFGGMNDLLITSRISQEYFRYGKGIAPGEGFVGRVTMLGLQAGFGPGAMVGCVYLYLNSHGKETPPLTWTALTKLLWIPVMSAVTFGTLLPLCFSAYDPLSFQNALQGLLSPDQISRFKLVWWIHGGLYLGGIIGLILGGMAVRRSRKEMRRSMSD